MSSTWIFDGQCGALTASFRGTARLLQSYYAVAVIVILLFIHIMDEESNSTVADLKGNRAYSI